MAATLSFNRLSKIMTVDLPDTEITIQEIHNQIREYSAELINLSIEQMINSGGKEDLKNGSFVGITSTLLDDWQIAFAARPGPAWVQCEIKGGNIVATNSAGPIFNTPYVNVNYAASSSSTLIETGVSGLTPSESAQLSGTLLETRFKLLNFNKEVTRDGNDKIGSYGVNNGEFDVNVTYDEDGKVQDESIA